MTDPNIFEESIADQIVSILRNGNKIKIVKLHGQEISY